MGIEEGFEMKINGLGRPTWYLGYRHTAISVQTSMHMYSINGYYSCKANEDSLQQ